MIGLGILRTPGEVAEVVHHPSVFVSLWLIGGLFILLSTLIAGELIGLTPRSGGMYVLVRSAYGPFPGFVIGWVDWLSFVSDIALKAVVVTEFATLLIPAVGRWQTPLAIIVSSLFAVLQLRSIALGAKIQQIAAVAMVMIVLGFTLALLFAKTTVSDPGTPILKPVGWMGPWSMVVAAIIYTYDGWLFPSYFSGEVKGGSRAVIGASIRGVVIVIVLYVFLAAVLALKVPLIKLAGSELALATALEISFSPMAAKFLLVGAIIITLAHQNLLYLSTPRILQALAVDGLAVRFAGKFSKGGNPIFAVLLSYGLSVFLILIGGFKFLLHLSVMFYVFLYSFLILGVLIIRSRQPNTERPYRAWGHPWSTYICLGIWLILALFQSIVEKDTALFAVIMVAVAWPIYRILVRIRLK